MTHFTDDLTRWWWRVGAIVAVAVARERPDRDDRGDVPGWVMITVMSAGIVAALTAFVGPELQGMLRSALSSVK